MNYTLLKTRSVVDDCEEFLAKSNYMGSSVESYLVQHALVVMCADVQQVVYRIAKDRADEATDKQIANFISVASRRILRSVTKKELAMFAGMFGEAEKDRFNEAMDDAEVTRYNNAVNNRHDVAHKSGVQVTFSELKQALVAAENILDSLSKAISTK